MRVHIYPRWKFNMFMRMIFLTLSILSLSACDNRMAVRLNSSTDTIVPPATSEVIISEDVEGLRPVIIEAEEPPQAEENSQAAIPEAEAEAEPAPSRAEIASRLSAPIYFALDSFALSDAQTSQLAELAKFLTEQENREVNIRIEGHCDDRGTREYNFALGSARANTIAAVLLKGGISKARISTISYGKERPKYPGNSTPARAKNRRGDIILRPIIIDTPEN